MSESAPQFLDEVWHRREPEHLDPDTLAASRVMDLSIIEPQMHNLSDIG